MKTNPRFSVTQNRIISNIESLVADQQKSAKTKLKKVENIIGDVDAYESLSHKQWQRLLCVFVKVN